MSAERGVPGYCFRYEPCGHCHRCAASAEKVPCTCGASVVTPYPNDTGYHSTTECIDEATGRVIPPASSNCGDPS